MQLFTLFGELGTERKSRGDERRNEYKIFGKHSSPYLILGIQFINASQFVKETTFPSVGRRVEKFSQLGRIFGNYQLQRDIDCVAFTGLWRLTLRSQEQEVVELRTEQTGRDGQQSYCGLWRQGMSGQGLLSQGQYYKELWIQGL